MARIEYRNSGNKTAANVRSFAEARKVEELKLGKFAKCEPLRLPEKKVRRCWQIAGGIGFIVAALVLIITVFMIKPVRTLTWQPDGFGPFEGLSWYWLVMVGCMIVVALCGLIMGVLLLLSKRVPVFFWYLLIASATVGLLCASFNSFKWFEERRCYENYPGIFPDDPHKGSGCPSVGNDLVYINLRNLAIYTVGLLGLFWAHKIMKRRVGGVVKPKH